MYCLLGAKQFGWSMLGAFYFLLTSVSDTLHFNADPDPWIRFRDNGSGSVPDPDPNPDPT